MNSLILKKINLKLRQFNNSSQRYIARVIDGRAMAEDMLNGMKMEIEEWIKAGGKRPCLAALLIGNDPASAIYVRNKMKTAESIGISSHILHMKSTMSENHVLSAIERLNADDEVDAILVQMPIPRHMRERYICNALAPHKDVDGFNVINIGKFSANEDAILPATPAGVMELIKRAGIVTKGRNAVVCGRSKTVGMPLALLLQSHMLGDATTTICHRHTPEAELRKFASMADILVVAVGSPGLIKGDMIKEGCAVIDVGINRIIDPTTGRHRVVGDVDFKSVSEKASVITPVPGGIGPMTIAMLMQNTIRLAKKQIDYQHCLSSAYDNTNNSITIDLN